MPKLARATRRLTPNPGWNTIHAPDCSIVIEPRVIEPLHTVAVGLARMAVDLRGEGPMAEALRPFAAVPSPLRTDIHALVHRFAGFMNVNAVRIRLEAISSDACRKIHADYTDLRLITTYAGPGSLYIPHGAPAEETELCAVPPGAVALFKGRLFHPDHVPCYHRSPRIAAARGQRLVLVIDTPLRQPPA